MSDLNDDIAKYLSGKLSAAEMHALEKKALDDPFLAEALEGASVIAPTDFASDVAGLRAKLHQRVQQKPAGKSVTLWSWPVRIAAGLLLLVSATVVIVMISQQPAKQDLAMNQNAPVVPKVADSTAESLTDSSESTKVHDAFLSYDDKSEDKSQAKRKNKPQGEPQDKSQHKTQSKAGERPKADATVPLISEKDTKEAEQVLADEAVPTARETQATTPVPQTEEVHSAAELAIEEKLSQAAANSAPPDNSITQPLQRREASNFTLDEADKKKERAEAAGPARPRSQEPVAGAALRANTDDANTATHVVKGKVTARDGSELPGVNVMIRGTNIGTVTDMSGNFQLTVTEDPTLLFSFIGYSNIEMTPGDATDLNVKLDEDMTQLSEVVVAGYGITRDPTEINSTLELATPEGGKQAFKQYLENNIRYPDAAVTAKVEGKVTIQFFVETTGALSDFKVLNGIGSGCDEEVIRLIKAGPKWSPTKLDTKSQRDLVKVRMRFQLPKK